MSENINVGTDTNKMEQIRKDFSSISDEIFKLLKIAEILKSHEQDWSDLKNKEDFARVYNLDDKVKEHLEVLYADGRPLAREIGSLLFNINAYVGEYPTLTSVVESIEKYWINDERIHEYKNILEQSNKVKNSYQINLFSINAMQRLFQKQIKYLEQIQVIVKMLKESDLYKKESLFLIETKGVISSTSTSPSDTDKLYKDAPEKIKTLLWFWNLTKKHPIKGVSVVVIFMALSYVSVFYEYFKHDVNVLALHTEATQEEKIKLKHIFFTGETFVNLLHEMRDYRDVEFSGYKNSLQEHFSALGFNGSKLFEDINIDQLTWMKNYSDVRSEFNGHIDRNFAKYSSLYNAGVNLSVYINSGEKNSLEDFVKNWRKFQQDNDFVTPDLDFSNIKSPNDAIKIYLEIQKWLNQ